MDLGDSSGSKTKDSAIEFLRRRKARSSVEKHGSRKWLHFATNRKRSMWDRGDVERSYSVRRGSGPGAPVARCAHFTRVICCRTRTAEEVVIPESIALFECL